MNSIEHGAYVGREVYKEMIAVAYAGREEPEWRGEIRNEPQVLHWLVKHVGQSGEILGFLRRRHSHQDQPEGEGIKWLILRTSP